MSYQAISHYQIIKKLGAGGVGEVYLARDTKLNRDVTAFRRRGFVSWYLPPEGGVGL